MKPKTLEEAAQNPDGTYDAFKAGAWMIKALHGVDVTPKSIKAVYERMKKEKADRE